MLRRRAVSKFDEEVGWFGAGECEFVVGAETVLPRDDGVEFMFCPPPPWSRESRGAP